MAQTSRRPAFLGLVGVLALVTGCASWVPQDLQVPKLYIKDYALRVRGEQYAGTAAQAQLDRTVSVVSKFGNIGVFVTPQFMITSDPVLLLHTSEFVELPNADTVEETYIEDNETKVRRVLRKPLYMLERITVSYNVPNYSIPSITIEQNLPIKSNDLTLEPLSIAQVAPIMSAFANGSITPMTPVSGYATFTLDIRDLDPMAKERNFKVSRVFPLQYSYNTILGGETIDQGSPAPQPSTNATGSPGVGGEGATSPSPSPSPSPTPTTTPSAP